MTEGRFSLVVPSPPTFTKTVIHTVSCTSSPLVFRPFVTLFVRSSSLTPSVSLSLRGPTPPRHDPVTTRFLTSMGRVHRFPTIGSCNYVCKCVGATSLSGLHFGTHLTSTCVVEGTRVEGVRGPPESVWVELGLESRLQTVGYTIPDPCHSTY